MNEQHTFVGTHVLGEFYGVNANILNDAELLKQALQEGVEASGATVCSWQIKQFEPSGLTIVAILSESHTSIHTYPDEGSLFFDAFTCGSRCKPQAIAKALENKLSPKKLDLKVIIRGNTE